MTYGRGAADLTRLLRYLRPYLRATTIAAAVAGEAFRTGHVDPGELRRALLTVAAEAAEAAALIERAVAELHAEAHELREAA